MTTSQRSGRLTLVPLLLTVACAAFTALVLAHAEILGILIPIAGNRALLLFPRAAWTGAVLGTGLPLVVYTLWRLRRCEFAAAQTPCQGRWLHILSPLSLLPLALYPAMLRGFFPDIVAANVLFFLPVAVLATIAIRLLAFGASRIDRVRLGPMTLAGIVGACTLFYMLIGWYFTRMAGEHSGDEGHYLIQARSLYTDGDLDLRNNLGPDDSDTHPREWYHVSHNSRGDHWYSWHPFGLSLLLWPTMGAGLFVRHFLLGLIAAAGVGGMLALCRCFRARTIDALFVTALFSCSAYWGIYACRALPEVLGATLMLWLTVATFTQAEHPSGSLLTAALCAMGLPWVHTRFIPLSLAGISIYFLFGLSVEGTLKNRLVRLVLFGGLCAAGYVLYLFVMLRMFTHGCSYPVGSLLLAYPAGIWHSLLSKRGVLYALPMFAWLLMAALYILTMERESRHLTATLLLQVMAVLATSCATPWFDGGACLPGRFLLVTAPLLVGPAARALGRTGTPAQWWLAFLGLTSCLTWALVLLHLPAIQRSFAVIDVALPEVLPLLRGWLQPLRKLSWLDWPFFSLTLYVATGLLVCLGMRAQRWQRLLILAMVAAAVWSNESGSAHGGAPDPVWNAETLDELDLTRCYVATRGPVLPPIPLLEVVNRFHTVRQGAEPVSVTTRDLGSRIQKGVVSQPRLDINDWCGRNHRWTTLVAPFPAGPGWHLFRLTGRIEGNLTGVVVVRKGSRTLLERAMTKDANGHIDVYQALDCSKGGHVYVLIRLETGAGSFIPESVAWAPCAPHLLAYGGLVLPAQALGTDRMR